MKRTVLSAALLLITLCLSAQYRSGTSYSDLYDSETVRAFKAHVGDIASVANEGRRAGSEGEAAAATYVEQVMKAYGVDVISPEGGDTFGIELAGSTITSRNIVGFIQGFDKNLRDRYIVVAARLDNLGTDTLTVNGEPVRRTYTGANGNASGLAMLLELSRMLVTNRMLLRRSVIVLALGSSLETYAGARYFLEHSFSDAGSIDAMVNLDMLGTGASGFYAFTASNADLNAVATTLGSELFPLRPELVTQEPYPSDNRAFYSKEIPSVLFTTGRYPEYQTEKDTPSILDYEDMERELEYIYQYTVALISGEAPRFNPNTAGKGRKSDGVSVVAFYDTDVRPTFLGSPDPGTFMEKWVYHYLRYPEEALKKGVQGRVLVDFIIDENGNVRDAVVTRGVDPLLDQEALRVISASPKWKPGRSKGKRVKTAVSVPVEFRLEKKDKGKGLQLKLNNYIR